MNSENLMQFVQIPSFIESSFWNKLAQLKLNVDKMDEPVRKIWGYVHYTASIWNTHVMELDSTSFNSDFQRQDSIPFHGEIHNRNTIEQFKECNKTELINHQGQVFLEHLKKGDLLKTPSLINFFFLLSYSDLKKYRFYYWFAFPVPHKLKLIINKECLVTECIRPSQLRTLSANFRALDPFQRTYFLIQNDQVYTLESELKEVTETNFDTYYFAFAESLSSIIKPKSQIKNYALLLLHYCPFLGGQKVNFLAFILDKDSKCSHSVVYKLTLPLCDSGVEQLVYGDNGANAWYGWEKDSDKFRPRVANMKDAMDPESLYEKSVDLNMKLMKWRLVPDIDLEKIGNLKCLLLGAGTLGCSISRTLLGWGIRHITFVDNSRVSYSNPIRQSLFSYDDAMNGHPKALAAARNLHAILPQIKSEGYQFTIPMPGHPVALHEKEEVAKSISNLISLIENHDFIFLLTDSRESRWLPTVLGIYYKKNIINVALGFDSYLVMRYGGVKSTLKLNGEEFSKVKRLSGTELGCYFCNDVTAPGDSMKDRSLDQQCTVTRPGVSAIAGALASELAISITQHPLGMDAPAFCNIPSDKDDTSSVNLEESILGIVPHSIRGFLSSYRQILPATPKYDRCIACSSSVLDAYHQGKNEFLFKVFLTSKYLEEVTGLDIHLTDEKLAEVLEISSDTDSLD